MVVDGREVSGYSSRNLSLLQHPPVPVRLFAARDGDIARPDGSDTSLQPTAGNQFALEAGVEGGRWPAKGGPGVDPDGSLDHHAKLNAKFSGN